MSSFAKADWMQQIVPLRDVRSRDQLKKAALGFIVCSLILAAGVFTRTDNFQLTLEMSSQVASTAQVFYDTGSGYSESESRTAEVRSNVSNQFSTLTFNLPDGIRRLRFDPLTTAGSFTVRNFEVHGPGGVLRIDPQQIRPLNQIGSRVEKNNEVAFTTISGANDPSLVIAVDVVGPGLTHMKRWHAFHLFLMGLPVLAAGAIVVLLLYRHISSGGILGRAFCSINSSFRRVARQISVPGFIQFDAYAIWFYAVCGAAFLAGGLADLNGSSAGMFSSVYGHGAKQQTWIGAPRSIRSDEWAYVTPNIFNQSLRSAPFEARDSELGSHFAALTGNIPVRHISTLFRPQLWPFFFLRVDYAYAFNWQSKALLLLTGMFTWLLLITESTRWAATGSLWFFFSPFTQWSYSWPSALPEMIGSVCLAMVLGCFLTVGRNAVALTLAAAGLTVCCINFAMCAYVPHLVPLFWLAVFFSMDWCVAHRKQIFTRSALVPRAGALLAAALIVGAIGTLVYSDLHVAIVALAHTAYPGRRAFSGGVYPAYALASHFLEWTEREDRFPAILVNICEGSGFLWLAPVTLLCIPRMRMSASQKLYCLALWTAFCFLLTWLILPVPARFGALFGLQETAGARLLPALGLANVAIVSLCMASLRMEDARNSVAEWRRFAAGTVLASVAMLLILRATNEKLGFFFARSEVVFAALAAGLLIVLMVTGRKSAFALWLVLPQAVVFSVVNPVQRGLPVFTSSQLLAFVRQHPELREGKWMVFSDSVVSSGFLVATGCEVYTGTRYLPDIDHFGLFAANHYDMERLNRGGYLTAHLRLAGEPAQMQLPNHSVMQWDVMPSDPIVKQLGIRYVAFDQSRAPLAGSELIALAPAAVDGFWLYRLR